MFASAKARALGVAFVVVLLFAGMFMSLLRAQASADDSANLLDNPLSVTKLVDNSTQITTNMPDCTNMTVQVMRNILNQLVARPETYCMVSTSIGLIDRNNAVIQPVGFSKAYPLAFSRGGHPVLIPVPGSTAALFIVSDPAYPGVDVGIYDNWYGHLIFNSNPFDMKFTLQGEPTSYLKYADGRSMAFNIMALNFSSDGRYVITDGIGQGMVRIDLLTHAMVTIAQDIPRINDSGLLPAVTALSADGHYAAIAYNAPLGWGGNKYIRIVDVDSCGNVTAAFNKATTTCKSRDIYSTVMGNLPGFVSVDSLAFTTDSSLLITARYTYSGTTYTQGQFMVSPVGQPTSLKEYLALGDSYISGEGIGSYVYGTDSDDNKCHLSPLSYPYLIGKKLSSVASVACSGAKIQNIIGNGSSGYDLQLSHERTPSPEEKSSALENFIPGFNLQKTFLANNNPKIVTVSIGGNDVGFEDIVTSCVSMFHINLLQQNCYDTYESRHALLSEIDAQFNNLYNTYRQLKINAPTRRVYVIGYPQIVNPEGSCAVNVHISNSEAQFATQLIDYLDGVIAAAALKAGVTYVDVQHAFDGHRLCDVGKKAVNGLTKGDDRIIFIGSESYHPNAYGHELLADYISKKTDDLTSPMPDPQDVPNPVASDNLPILQAVLNTHQQIYDIQNVNTSTEELLFAGSNYSIPAASSPPNLAPNSSFNVVLHSTPIQLGTVYSNASGVITGTVHIPDNIPAGFHTIHYYGKNIAGDPIDIQDVVYVGASANDYDGDGVLNDNDSCPAMPQSGSDVDKDGIDDACDGDIGAAPMLPGPTKPSDNSSAPTASFVLTNVNDIAPQALLDVAHINFATTVNSATQNPTLEPQVLHAMVNRPAAASYSKTSTGPKAKTSNFLRVGLGTFGLLIAAGFGHYLWRLKTK